MQKPDASDHYLKCELYDLVKQDPEIFDFLQAGSLDGIWYWDLEEPLHEWMSSQFWSTLGYNPADKKHLASEWQEIIFQEDLHKAVALFKQHVEDPKVPYDMVVRYRHRLGHTVWIRCRGIAIRDENGKPIRMLGAHNDVSGLKEAEEKHARTAQMLERIRQAQSLFLTSGDIKASFDLMLKTLLEGTNSEYGFIGEVLIQEESGQPYLKTHAITNIAWNEETRNFYEQNAPTGLEFYNLDSLFGSVIVTKAAVIANDPGNDPRRCGIPPGHPPLNHFLGLPFFYGDDMIGMVGIANRPGGYDHDIIQLLDPFLSTCSNLIVGFRNETQRRLAEEARKKAQEALISAKDAAERANDSKSRFLATMSHEIRTPLNGILGMAQMLSMPDLTEAERQDAARTILNSGQTLLALLNDILDLAKIEEGKISIKPTPVSIPALVKETVDLYLAICKTKGLELSCKIDPDVNSRYVCDPIRLRQMLSNYISNAIKFTESGSIQIHVQAKVLKGNDHLLEFSVRDTGEGIEDSKLDRLFKPFSQIDNSTKREQGGTGLGLFLVRRMAEMMEGTAGVATELGVGSRFWFTVKATTIRAAIVQQEQAKQVLPKPTKGKIEKILVVEDNRINLKVVGNFLKRGAYMFETATNGLEAVTYLETAEKRPDLILMDCHMPKMDGFDATRTIRQWEQEKGWSPIVIIALTADVYLENKQKCLDTGMNDFLEKPVKFNRLLEKLEKWSQHLDTTQT